jgi:D-tyrosyl-tRNA(Tyr) deacylase
VRALVQRVSRASVRVDGKTVASIGDGLLLLLAVTHSDGPDAAAYVADKAANLRVFADEDGKMNRSLLETGGSVIVVSQFTLYADTRRGRRPSFVDAAPPETAEPLVRDVVDRLRSLGVATQAGEFGAHMEVDLTNDGPVTILVET